MNQQAESTVTPTPWHLWFIGVLAVLWSSVGCLDYFMTETKNEEYLSGFEPELLEYFYSFPTWMIALWAVAVWGGLLGAIVLLLRKRQATPILIASTSAMLITTVRNYGFSDGMKFMGDTTSLVLTGLIVVIGVALIFYARAMTKRGVLR
jgi:hypothetical protein